MAEKQPFAVQAAKFSFWAPFAVILLNVWVMASSPPQPTRTVISLISIGLYGAGLLLGVAALLGVRKHGRKGILVRAVLGITLNGLILLLFVSSIPLLVRARNMARENEAAAQVEPFSFTAPPQFIEFPEGKNASPDFLQFFIKGDPTDQEPDIILVVEDLGGKIGQEDMSLFFDGKDNIRLLHENWKSHEIPVIEIQESVGDVPFLTYNAQVPLLPHALQIKVAGPADKQAELQETLRNALSGLDGTSNW